MPEATPGAKTLSLLPDWLTSHEAVEAGTATPLQAFIAQHQPGTQEAAEPWRAMLLAAIQNQS